MFLRNAQLGGDVSSQHSAQSLLKLQLIKCLRHANTLADHAYKVPVIMKPRLSSGFMREGTHSPIVLLERSEIVWKLGN